MSGFQDPECTVFVSNVDSKVTSEHLWELFLQAGPLRNVHIPVDKGTGKNRTFAFICFRHEVSVPYACELFNTLKMFERPIYCKPNNKDGKQSSTAGGSPSNLLQDTPHRRDDRSFNPNNSSNRDYRDYYSGGSDSGVYNRDNRDYNRRSYDSGNNYQERYSENNSDRYNNSRSNQSNRPFDLRNTLPNQGQMNSGNVSPIYLKAVNHSLQHNSYNYNQSPHHNSPTNFGPTRENHDRSRMNRNDRSQRFNPY